MYHFLDFQSLQSPKFEPGIHIQELFRSAAIPELQRIGWCVPQKGTH